MGPWAAATAMAALVLACPATTTTTTSSSPISAVGFEALLCDWQVSLPGRAAMVSPRPVFAWGLSTDVAAARALVQDSFQLQVLRPDACNGSAALSPVFDSGRLNASTQTFALPGSAEALEPQRRYLWRVRVSVNHSDLGAWSAPRPVFTGLAPANIVTPIWAPPKGGAQPGFAFFRAALTLPPATQAVVESALVYVTASGPVAKGDRQKLLSAYKLWVGGELIGSGPGRARCGPMPCLGAAWSEQVYDGFDLTGLVANHSLRSRAAAATLPVFLSAYGEAQPPHVAPGVALFLEVTLASCASARTGLVARARLNLTTSSPPQWEAYDADAAYNTNGSTGGGAWFFQPRENTLASVLQADLAPGDPLRPVAAARTGRAATGAWAEPVAAPAFRNMTRKPTRPISVAPLPAGTINVTRVAAGHYRFDLQREAQATLQLSVALSPAFLDALPPGVQPNVTVRLGEELNPDGSVRFIMRTGNEYYNTWSLLRTTAPQRLQHHEYMEFRHGELLFQPLASTAAACATVQEGSVADIGCGLGRNITGFAFASYGTPSGSCTGTDSNSFRRDPSCDAAESAQALSRACVGKQACSVLVDNSVFGGDPCHETHKWLSYQATCSGPALSVGSRRSSAAPPHTSLAADPDLGAFNLTALVYKMGYEHDLAATMWTSDPTLNDIWELCRYTIEATTLDLYTDSNTRQRSSNCMADDVTAAQSTYATVLQVALQRYHAEQVLAAGPASRADWSILAVVMVYEHTLHTGDLSLADGAFDALRTNFSLEKNIDPSTGLLQGATPLVDWPPNMMDGWTDDPHTHTSTIGNAWGYYGLTCLARLADWTGRAPEAAQLRSKAAAIKVAVNKLMWNGTAFCDAACANVSHTAFHSSAYALAFGVASDDHLISAWQYTRGRIAPPFGPGPPPPPLPPSLPPPDQPAPAPGAWPPPPPPNRGMPCGSYVGQFAVQAMYANAADNGISALQVLTSDAYNSWVSMLAQGATTTMEMWHPDEKPNLTFSHPWAGSPAFLIPWFLFGIRAVSPGFAEVAVAPSPGLLGRGSYTLPTVRGPVEVSFTQAFADDGLLARFELRVALPVGVRGQVSLPAPPADKATAVVVVVNGERHHNPLPELPSARTRTFSVGGGTSTLSMVVSPGR